MDILYQDEEFCMEFSTEEIETELIWKLRDSFNIDIQIDYEGPNNSIDYISIEPEKDNLAIRFYGFETALYVFDEKIRFLYKGIIIKHNKTEPTSTKTSLFLCEKRRFFMARTEKGGNIFKLAGPRGLAFFHLIKKEVSKWPMKK